MAGNDDSDEGEGPIWENATTLPPRDTGALRVQITLSLEAKLYRAIFAEQKAAQDQAITTTIERLLHQGLDQVKR
jgi:hypothetical protein